MKRILLVTVDLVGPSAQHQSLFDVLKKQGRWWHYMKSTWLIYTDKSPDEIVENLKPYLGRVRVLVVPFSKPYQGILPKDAWEWIHQRERGE